jgi:ABC-type antimicrobial peptide transport system permease subunit
LRFCGTAGRGMSRTVSKPACGVPQIACWVIVLGLTVARVLKNLIYHVSPADPLTFMAVGLIVVAIAVLACYVPARKATRADPMIALRAE